MLSRHADACFWLGRYVERVEATARAIDVVYHVRLERQLRAETMSWDSILAVYGLDAEASERDAIHRLVFDETNAASIRTGLRAARENAASLRDLISSEMWEAINEAFHQHESWDADRVLRRAPHVFFRRTRNSLRLFDGVTSRTLLGGEGREFLETGRYLERAGQVARVLDLKYHHVLPAASRNGDETRSVGGEVDLEGWAAVLRSVGAYEGYTVRHGAGVTPAGVVGFLVLDADFPGSVAYSVERVEASLRRISGNRGLRPATAAERAAGRLHRDLLFGDGREVVAGGLHEFLVHVVARCDDIGTAISDLYSAA